MLELSFFVKKTRRRRKFWFWLIGIFFLISLTVYSLQLVILTAKYYNPPRSHFTNNYFLTAEDAKAMGYNVHTPTCNILNISAWDEAILPILLEEDNPPENCHLRSRQWTYIQGSNLVINLTAMTESGYSLNTVSCCYFTISRVEQSIENYDTKADLRIRYSACTLMDKVITAVTMPYIRVHCKGKYWPVASEVLYRQFHAFALLPTDSKAQYKIKHWRNQSRGPKPPNVVIIGIDSMSRLSFQRTMPKTARVLEKLKAVEMLGYTKVGENTLPNVMAGFAGYHEAELRSYCFLDDAMLQDGCPYLWQRFSEANYMTAFIEDAPHLAIFHYLKTGFVKQPTDIYFRPFMLGVHKHEATPLFAIDCIGPNTVDEVILRYISGINNMAREAEVPLFLFSWMTNLAHGSLMGGKYADNVYADFLKNLNLNNTLLFFMSDHGYRFGSIRQTFAGWYEDKLPNFWVYLPEKLEMKHRDWRKILNTNSLRLTSTFDLFRTLSHILDEFTLTSQLPMGNRQDTGEIIQRKYGQSLFEEVPLLRRCHQAGVPDNICACVVPQKLSLNDTHLEGAAKAAVDHINSLIPPPCAQLSVANLDAGAVLNLLDASDGSVNSTYIVAFVTTPGDFLFEANVNFSGRHDETADLGNYTITSDVLRMNKITTDVSCIRDGFMEKLCYCKTLTLPDKRKRNILNFLHV